MFVPDALTLDPFASKYPVSCGTKGGGGGGSADNILDSSDSAYFDTNFNLHSSDSTSCPHLEGKLVTHSTQTDPQPITNPGSKRRPPQLGASRYTAVNTSTGSSTSGVEVSSVSTNRSGDIYTLPPHHKKSVLIVKTACTPDLSSPEDPENPLCRYRTSSFKRAIERGQSNDSSNQSFETNDPDTTSPDLTPDKSEPPSYLDSLYRQHSGSRGSTHLHAQSHVLQPPSHHQEVVVNFALKPDQYSVHSTDNGSIITPLYPLSAKSLTPDYSKHRWGTTTQSQPSLPNTSETVHIKQPESILKDSSNSKKSSKKVVDIQEGGGGLWDLQRQDSGGSMDQVFVDAADSLQQQSANLLSVADLEG